MGHIIITGGSGYLGRALTRELTAAGHAVIILARRAEQVGGLPPGARAVAWDGRTADGWGDLANGAYAIVNMAGATIARPHWSAAYKQQIRDSRANAGVAVTAAIRAARIKPAVLVQMSGIGFYGDTADREVDEGAPAGSDYFATVCTVWEASTDEVESLGVRRVIVRTAPVYGQGGGIFTLVALPFRLFAGGPLGSGRQYAPWIHLADWLTAVKLLMDNPNTRGVYNLTAPDPLTQGASAKIFGRALGRPSFMPAPAFALRLALGPAADLLLLTGQRAQPRRLLEAGFRFRFPELGAAIRDITGKRSAEATASSPASE
ncbi:MAG: TIGR01777 family protein [Chloroflexi bacterium]|nr:TIGR01777 family protein [Chloroflexota bacterium]